MHSEVRHNLYLAVREALNNVAKHAEATEAWLRIHWEAGILYMTVEDNGHGFSIEETAASGNGLQNMRRRLEKIGGHFECEARPGKRNGLPDERTAGKDGDTGMNIAIVEDNRGFREKLESFLNGRMGFRCVCTCGTAEEALKIIPKMRPNVVLMDLHLPNMSGEECTRQLKAICPDVQILILTVYEDNDRIFGSLKSGASGYLLKRADPAEILQAIREVNDGGAPMSSQIARRVVQSFREPEDETEKMESLSQRELEILQALSKGYTSKEISRHLSISVSTVNTHLRHIYDKLHVRSRTEAILKFLQ